jgi:hypothetical protein
VLASLLYTPEILEKISRLRDTGKEQMTKEIIKVK